MQNFLASQFLPLLLKASWQAAVIILLVLAAQSVLGRRWNPRCRHALWWLVVARLALPVTIPSPVSLFNVFPHPGEAAPVVDVGATPSLPSIAPPAEEAAAIPVLTPDVGAGVPWWPWLWVAG